MYNLIKDNMKKYISIIILALIAGFTYGTVVETDTFIFNGPVTTTNLVNNGTLNGAGQWNWVVNPTAYSTAVTNPTTMLSATNLGFNVVSNTTYLIQGWINHTSSAATVGVWLGVKGPVYTALAGKFISSMAGITMANIPIITTNVCASPSTSSFNVNNNLDTIDCYYSCGSTSGYFNIMFAAEATGTVGIKNNSILRYKTIP